MGAASRDFFGTAYGKHDGKFDGFRFGSDNIQIDDTLLLIDPDAAKAYEASQRTSVVVPERTDTGRQLDNLVKRHLKPVLAKAGITEGGMHAFRHGNATLMDQANVPMKIRQDRLGHVDPKTTLGYTHAISEDEKRVAAEFDSVLCPDVSKTENLDDERGDVSSLQPLLNPVQRLRIERRCDLAAVRQQILDVVAAVGFADAQPSKRVSVVTVFERQECAADVGLTLGQKSNDCACNNSWNKSGTKCHGTG